MSTSHRQMFSLCAVSFTVAAAISACAAGSARSTSEGAGASGAGGAGGGGLLACAPGKGTCADGKATICDPDGKGTTEFECDPLQGMTCNPDGCSGACSPFELGPSYLGCDYYPTVTLNPVWSGFSFAVAAVNTKGDAAKITVTRGTDVIATDTIEDGGVRVIKLPWVTELKGGDWGTPAFQPPPPGATRVVKGGAYRLRSDHPITVYQLSPLEYSLPASTAGCPLNNGECSSFSNDASLLLPKPALTRDYTVLAWPSHPLNNPGFIAITGTEDNTVVSVLGSGAIAAGAGLPASGSGEVTLGAGDVLEIVAAPADVQSVKYGSDLSGTRVAASKPVQVIAGHLCAAVPTPNTAYCDHLEEAMFPVETLGNDAIVTAPAAPGGGKWPYVIRVAAVETGTTVHFDPAVAPDAVLGPGEPPLEVVGVTEDVHVTSDRAVIIAQVMVGSTVVGAQNEGDPSLSLAIPTAQYRASYVFLSSSTYKESYVNVIAKKGRAVTLDGAAIPAGAFTPIGASDFVAARSALSKVDVHSIEGDGPFGIVVYGFGDYTSYMYPGGLDLAKISPPPPL